MQEQDLVIYMIVLAAVLGFIVGWIASYLVNTYKDLEIHLRDFTRKTW